MENGQNLIDKIIAEANAQAKAIKDEAQKVANEAISAAQAKADKEAEAYEKVTVEEAKKAVAKQLSAADMEAKMLILKEKQKCIEEVIAEAENRLMSLKGDEYKKVILSMIKNADCNGSEVILSSKDRDALKADIEAAGVKVSDETRDIDGGFVVKKGDIEYNYSFNSIITVEKEEIQQLVAGILFK